MPEEIGWKLNLRIFCVWQWVYKIAYCNQLFRIVQFQRDVLIGINLFGNFQFNHIVFCANSIQFTFIVTFSLVQVSDIKKINPMHFSLSKAYVFSKTFLCSTVIIEITIILLRKKPRKQSKSRATLATKTPGEMVFPWPRYCNMSGSINQPNDGHDSIWRCLKAILYEFP